MIGIKAAVVRLGGLLMRQQILNARARGEEPAPAAPGTMPQSEGGFFGRMVSAVKSAVLPKTEEAVERIEAEMQRDLANVPKPWTFARVP